MLTNFKNIDMDKTERNKMIKKAAKSSVIKKYKRERWVFQFALLGICYIEFMPCLHCPSIWDADICLKINNLTSQLLLAYIASYIFFYLNILRKEQRMYEDYYPQIIQLLNNLFNVFDSHERCLKSLFKRASKGKSFLYNADSIRSVIEYLKAREKIYLEIYGNEIDNKYTPANEITGSNYLTAGQISYDIELLNNLSEVFSSDFKMALFRISQNLFILKMKDKQINSLKYYGLFVDEEIKLYTEIQNLRKEASFLFGESF